MKGWAVDGSLALAWLLPDETSPMARRFWDLLAPDDVLWVPALWWLEIANGLAVAERRKRITRAQALRAAELCRGIPVETDPFSGPDALWRYLALSHEQGLTAYDAAYLELAERRGLILASLDSALTQAAKRSGLEILKI